MDPLGIAFKIYEVYSPPTASKKTLACLPLAIKDRFSKKSLSFEFNMNSPPSYFKISYYSAFVMMEITEIPYYRKYLLIILPNYEAPGEFMTVIASCYLAISHIAITESGLINEHAASSNCTLFSISIQYDASTTQYSAKLPNNDSV